MFYSYGKSWPNWTSWSQAGHYQESELECSEGKGICCKRKGQVYQINILDRCNEFAIHRCNEFCDGYNTAHWKNTRVRIGQYSKLPLNLLYLVLISTY